MNLNTVCSRSRRPAMPFLSCGSGGGGGAHHVDDEGFTVI